MIPFGGLNTEDRPAKWLTVGIVLLLILVLTFGVVITVVDQLENQSRQSEQTLNH